MDDEELEGRPLGAVRRAAAQSRMEATSLGAEMVDNLLVKAEKAARAGDEARVERYARRAAGLPFDTHQELFPGVQWAHIRVFSLLADFLEECVIDSDEEALWLDRVAELIAGAEQWTAIALCYGLAPVVVEARWRFRSTSNAARADELSRLSPGGDPFAVPEADHVAYIVGCVHAALAIEQAHDALLDAWAE